MSAHEYVSEAHRMAWPYADALSTFLGSNSKALEVWNDLTAEARIERAKTLPALCSEAEQWNLASLEIALAEWQSKRDYMRRLGIGKDALAVIDAVIAHRENRVTIARDGLSQ